LGTSAKRGSIELRQRLTVSAWGGRVPRLDRKGVGLGFRLDGWPSRPGARVCWLASARCLTGGAGSDLLLGQNGDDTLSCQASNDLMCGGRGNDRLTGGPGADRFSGGPGTDLATDLTPSQGDSQDTIP
jgi:RTX calcium-binding nonapeptide repeat (4 copies)